MLNKILNWLEQHNSHVKFGIVAIVLCLGAVNSLYLSNTIRYYDAREYLALARHLVDTKVFAFAGEAATASRPPGYSLFLSSLMSLGAGIIILRFANFILFGINILLLHRLVVDIGGKLAGIVGAIGLLAYPVFFYAAGTFYPQTLASTLLLTALVFIGTEKPPTVCRAISGGFCFGLLILTVPIFSLSLFVILIWLFLSYRIKAWKAALAIFLSAVFVLSIWSIRNYRVFGEFVFVSTNSGYNLLLGNNENATANSGMNADISKYEEMTAGMSETGWDKFLRLKAIEWILTNKKNALILYVKKVLHYFSYHDDLGTEGMASRIKDWIMIITYYPLLLIFIFRLIGWRWKQPSKKEILLVLLYIGNAFFMAIFFTRIRFRLPLDYLLISLAALFIVTALRKPQPKESFSS